MSEAVDWNKYTVQELKAVLAKYGLPVSGVKQDLITRIKEHEQKLDEEELAAQAAEKAKESGEDKNGEVDVQQEGKDEEQEQDEEEEGHLKEEEEEEEDGEETGEHEEGEHSKEERELFGDDDKELHDMMGGDDEDMEFVTLDKLADGHDDSEDKAAATAAAAGEKESTEEGETKDATDTEEKRSEVELEFLPPEHMHKYLQKQYNIARKNVGLYISHLTAKDVLGAAMVEWSNRAVFFCINHDREGKGNAVLHFTTQQECKEAKEALMSVLGEEIKCTITTDAAESDVKNGVHYQSESGHPIASRTLIIEEPPAETTEDQLCQHFPEALMVVKLEKTDQYKWDRRNYPVPQSVKNAYFVEFGSSKIAGKAIEEGKEYKIGETKLEVQLLQSYEEKYKRLCAKKLNESRERRWELLEKRKKEAEKVKDFKMSDKERIEMYNQLNAILRKRAALAYERHIAWEEKVLRKHEYMAQVVEIVHKINADSDHRMKDTQKFPESVRIMTKHTKECFKKTPAYENYLDYIEKKKQQLGSSYRGGRSARGGYNKWDYGRDRERSDSYRGRRRSSPGGYHDYQTKRRRVDSYDDRRSRRDDDGAVNVLKTLTETLTHKMSQFEKLADGMQAKERALDDAMRMKHRRSDSRSDSYRHYDDYNTSDGYSRSSSSYSSHGHEYGFRESSSSRGSKRGGYRGRSYDPNYRSRGRGRSYNY